MNPSTSPLIGCLGCNRSELGAALARAGISPARFVELRGEATRALPMLLVSELRSPILRCLDCGRSWLAVPQTSARLLWS